MKEIDEKTRTQIFSMYFGQEIAIEVRRERKYQKLTEITGVVPYVDGYAICVRDVDYMTEVEIQEVADIMRYKKDGEFGDIGTTRKEIITNLFKFNEGGDHRYYMGESKYFLLGIQWMQSKGFAMPFMNHSVQDIIDAGIYILIQNEYPKKGSWAV